MTCPECGKPTKITGTKVCGNIVVRERICKSCGCTFKTEEREAEIKQHDKTKLHGSVRLDGGFTGNAKSFSKPPHV